MTLGLGRLIGRKVGIRLQAQNDWQETSNMCALLIGRPDVLKSPAMEEACLLFKRTRSAPRNLTRFADQYPARGIPCERFTAEE
jgi:hypothetical protein